jgi:hypothetical protein
LVQFQGQQGPGRLLEGDDDLLLPGGTPGPPPGAPGFAFHDISCSVELKSFIIISIYRHFTSNPQLTLYKRPGEKGKRRKGEREIVSEPSPFPLFPSSPLPPLSL